MKINFKSMKREYKILLIVLTGLLLSLLIPFSTLYVYSVIEDRNIMVIRLQSLPEIEDINYQIAYYKHDLIGEQIVMQKEPEIRRLLEDAKKGNDVWDEIIELEKEIESMWKQTWECGEEYQRLKMIRIFSENPSTIITGWPCFQFMCDDFTAPLQYGSHYLTYWRPIRVWIGMYNGPDPNTSNFLGETCSTFFTADMSYYWGLAKGKSPILFLSK